MEVWLSRTYKKNKNKFKNSSVSRRFCQYNIIIIHSLMLIIIIALLLSVSLCYQIKSDTYIISLNRY